MPDNATQGSSTRPVGRSFSTTSLVLCALCIALLVASCFFTIPIGPVPFTLQTLVVILVALLCTPKQAAAITGIYLLMGACGLPVFSSMTGGLGKILGPTGGFLISYLVGTLIATNARRALEHRGVRQIVCDIVAATCIIVTSDVLGWLWLMVVTQSDPLAAFLMADAPFIAIDCCKAVVAIIIAAAVRKALPQLKEN
ncbi:MAG: biotin transporter BioY [Coriobacteriales bacterium]|jgi:biotin transport system substrate-specific component